MMLTGGPLGYSEKQGLSGRRSLCVALIFLLAGTAGMRIVRADDTAPSDGSWEEPETRAAEIQKALDRAQDPKKQTEEAEKKKPGKDEAPGEKDASGEKQGAEKQEELSLEEKTTKESSEDGLSEYRVLENITWEISGKKVIVRLWVSGQATPDVAMIRDQFGLKIRLRLKGLATRMPRIFSSIPPGVQSFTIRENPKLTKGWKLETPYYAIEEVRASFIMPVQSSLQQEPGLLKVTFSLPKKVEPKTIEPVLTPETTIQALQREALDSPGTTLGSNYQSQMEFQDRILYGVQKPISVEDLYKKERERESAEYKPESGLPVNVGPIFEARHPAFGSAEYLKKYVHGNIRQAFDFTTDYNDGTTSAFGESSSEKGEPGTGGNSGKDIGTILCTPAVALLFYRPGTFDVATGYSASRDFPTTHNNFLYGLNRQNINVGIGHYPRKRYAFVMQNDLRITGGTTRQKIGGKWVKASAQCQEGYQLNSNFGLNYRLSNRLIWGGGASMNPQWSEIKTTGVRNQTLTGGLNTYLGYQATPRLGLMLGTTYTHIFIDTAANTSSGSTGTSSSSETEGDNLQSVFLNASYRYSERLTLKGGFTGSLIDWDIGKVGGFSEVVYQGTHHDTLSLKYSSSVVQDSTAMILARTVNTANGLRISLQRVVDMGVRYSRHFDQGKTTGSLGFTYMRSSPLAGVSYGDTCGGSINYDLVFKASVRRAILKGRGSIGLLYSYEFSPNIGPNNVTGERDLTSDTSQNITVTMDYGF
jgi:hypothetical protein